MRKRYQRWMHDWEYRLTTRDTNRIVRPLEWGLDWAGCWPCVNGNHAEASHSAETYLLELNSNIIADSDRFYLHTTPLDFRLEKLPASMFARRSENNWNVPAADFGSHLHSKDARLCLRFTSPVTTPHEANNTATAQWFPARGRKAVIVMPQWNADGDSHNGLCRIFNFLGIAALRLSMPYHDVRMPVELQRADYACSSNIGRTIDATRQAVLDARACIDWLETQGYTQVGIMGTSLGSCYAFITAAHEPRIRACAYNHASTFFGDVVWTGQSTRHIREGLDGVLDQDRLRALWAAISPMSYFDQYQRFERKSLVVYASYDLTFLPEFSKEVVAEFQRRKLNFKVSILPCGHYTTGETPYKFLDAFYLSRFLASAFWG